MMSKNEKGCKEKSRKVPALKITFRYPIQGSVRHGRSNWWSAPGEVKNRKT